MATFSLSDSLSVREKLTKTQYNAILRLYKDMAKKAREEAAKLQNTTVSGRLQKIELEKLAKQLEEEAEKVGQKVEAVVKTSMKKASEAVISDAVNFSKAIGISMEGAYRRVPADIVETLVSGQLYQGKWSLSSAIWADVKKTQQDINTVVAEGLALNKSSYEIAKDLEKYVDPSAKKDWDWSKVYPGTKKKVDYSAQRLARTMVGHAYEQSAVAVTKNNPFVDGIKWISGHSDTNCEICKERNGKIFPADKLPLDHPNGKCSFAPVATKSSTDIADELADWVQGKPNKKMDKWFKDMYPEKSVEDARSAVSADMSSEIKTEKWVDKNLSKVRTQVTKNFGKDSWVALRSRLLELDETQLTWLAKGNTKLKSLLSDAGQGYWDERSGTLSADLKADIAGNRKQPYLTFFHEFGHLMDHKIGVMGRSFTNTKKNGLPFYDLLNEEYKELIDSSGALKRGVRDNLLAKDYVTSGIQDIISGLSRGKNNVHWCHSTDYWTRRDPSEQWKPVVSEAFANLHAAYMIPEVREEFIKYFPKSMEFFEEEVIGKYAK